VIELDATRISAQPLHMKRLSASSLPRATTRPSPVVGPTEADTRRQTLTASWY